MFTTEVPVKDAQQSQSSSKSNSQHEYAYEEEGIPLKTFQLEPKKYNPY